MCAGASGLRPLPQPFTGINADDAAGIVVVVSATVVRHASMHPIRGWCWIEGAEMEIV